MRGQGHSPILESRPAYVFVLAKFVSCAERHVHNHNSTDQGQGCIQHIYESCETKTDIHDNRDFIDSETRSKKMGAVDSEQVVVWCTGREQDEAERAVYPRG
jgi:hypothetical protein